MSPPTKGTDAVSTSASPVEDAKDTLPPVLTPPAAEERAADKTPPPPLPGLGVPGVTAPKTAKPKWEERMSAGEAPKLPGLGVPGAQKATKFKWEERTAPKAATPFPDLGLPPQPAPATPAEEKQAPAGEIREADTAVEPPSSAETDGMLITPSRPPSFLPGADTAPQDDVERDASEGDRSDVGEEPEISSWTVPDTPEIATGATAQPSAIRGESLLVEDLGDMHITPSRAPSALPEAEARPEQEAEKTKESEPQGAAGGADEADRSGRTGQEAPQERYVDPTGLIPDLEGVIPPQTSAPSAPVPPVSPQGASPGEIPDLSDWIPAEGFPERAPRMTDVVSGLPVMEAVEEKEGIIAPEAAGRRVEDAAFGLPPIPEFPDDLATSQGRDEPVVPSAQEAQEAPLPEEEGGPQVSAVAEAVGFTEEAADTVPLAAPSEDAAHVFPIFQDAESRPMEREVLQTPLIVEKGRRDEAVSEDDVADDGRIRLMSRERSGNYAEPPVPDLSAETETPPASEEVVAPEAEVAQTVPPAEVQDAPPTPPLVPDLAAEAGISPASEEVVAPGAEVAQTAPPTEAPDVPPTTLPLVPDLAAETGISPASEEVVAPGAEVAQTAPPTEAPDAPPFIGADAGAQAVGGQDGGAELPQASRESAEAEQKEGPADFVEGEFLKMFPDAKPGN